MTTIDHQQLQQLRDAATAAALAAGDIIASHRHRRLDIHYKQGSSSLAAQVVTEVDQLAQAAILDILEPTLASHDLALLTEESPDDGQRQRQPAFWCIDPLDGTLAFIERQPGYSVSIALLARDATPLIGVVYDPLEQTLYQAIRGHGATRNGRPLQRAGLDPTRPLTLRTDRSFRDHPWRQQTLRGLQRIAAELGLDGADICYYTGGTLNACGVLQTPNLCYFKYPKARGGSLWDYAASACLFHELGAVASDIYGQPMDLNRPDSTYMNHRGLLFANQPAVASAIIALHQSLAAG